MVSHVEKKKKYVLTMDVVVNSIMAVEQLNIVVLITKMNMVYALRKKTNLKKKVEIDNEFDKFK